MRLKIPARELSNLQSKLLSSTPVESAAFLCVEEGPKFLTWRSSQVFPNEAFEQTVSGELTLVEAEQGRALAGVKRTGSALVEIHTHPFTGKNVQFSAMDRQQLEEFARYVRLKLTRPFGALVFGRESYAGLYWGLHDEVPTRLALEAIGARSDRPAWVRRSVEQPVDNRYDRQARLFGADSQSMLKELVVGVVGLGGTGSQVVQQLAHLGVSSFVLADDDVVDETNLNRLVGATIDDAHTTTRKVQVAERTIRALHSSPRVLDVGSLRSMPALSELKCTDILVGCVDNDGARLVLAELAAAYHIPYLDIGVGVEASLEGEVVGGRVSFFVPPGPCLVCADEIDFDEAAEDLETESLRQIRLERGYARDRRIEPAVIPLNGVLVSLAIVELMTYVSGFRDVISFQVYEYGTGRLTIRNVPLLEDCVLCGAARGMGDRRQTDRYAIAEATNVGLDLHQGMEKPNSRMR